MGYKTLNFKNKLSQYKNMKDETKKWIKLAEEDFATAKANFEIKKYKFASYLCQQTVEKALKALLIEETNKFPKIHDLVELGKLLGIKKEFLKKLEKLTYVYIESRYSDVSEDKYTSKETQEDLKIAKEVLEWVRKRI